MVFVWYDRYIIANKLKIVIYQENDRNSDELQRFHLIK